MVDNHRRVIPSLVLLVNRRRVLVLDSHVVVASWNSGSRIAIDAVRVMHEFFDNHVSAVYRSQVFLLKYVPQPVDTSVVILTDAHLTNIGGRLLPRVLVEAHLRPGFEARKCVREKASRLDASAALVHLC